MTQAARDRTAYNKAAALAKRAARAKTTIAKPRWKISNATNSHFGMDDSPSAPTPRPAAAARANNNNSNSFLLLGRSATAATPTKEEPLATPTSTTNASYNNTNTNASHGITNDDPGLLLLCSAAAARTTNATHIPATARPPDNGDADATADEYHHTDGPPGHLGEPPHKARKLQYHATSVVIPTALRAHFATSDSTSSSSASGSHSADLDFTSVGFRGLVSPPSSSVQPTLAPASTRGPVRSP